MKISRTRLRIPAYRDLALSLVVFVLLSKGSIEESTPLPPSSPNAKPAGDKSSGEVDFDCKVTDANGNVFDLNELSKGHGSPWEIRDSRHGRSDLIYDLSICGLLRYNNNSEAEACAGKASACQRIESTDGKTTYKNMGLPEGPPTLNRDNATFSLRYVNGTFCHRPKKPRSTLVEFYCDPGADDLEGPAFVTETDDCQYNFIWRTRFVCPPSQAVPCSLRDPTSGEVVYDFSALRRSHRSYVSEVESYVDIHMNFCDALGPLPLGAEKACGASGACLITKNATDGTVESAVSLGEPTSPTYDNDGIGFNFTAVEAASNSSCTTFVRLMCSHDFVNPSPVVYFHVGCTTYMQMATPAACAVDRNVTNFDCGVQIGDDVVDLSPLRDAGETGGSYAVRTKDYDYVLNVCGPVRGGCHTNGSSTVEDAAGGCQRERYGHRRSFSTGDFSRQLRRSHGDVLVLEYDSGSPCRNADFNRTTLIYFFCDSHVSIDDSRPVFVEEKDECDYHFHWRTPFACTRKLECLVDVPAPTKFDPHRVDTIDLAASSLSSKAGNHEAIADGIHLLSQFFINVCRPVNHVSGMKCPPGAGICMPAIHQLEPQNLGFPASEPTWVETVKPTATSPAEGYILLTYSHGDICHYGNDSANQRISSELRLTCHPGADVGVPRLVNDDQLRCHFVFEWATNAACPPDSEVNERTCSVRFTEARYTFDLKALAEASTIESTIQSRYGLVQWNICDKITPPPVNASTGADDECANAAVCVEKSGKRLSYGTADRMRLQRSGEMILLRYAGGGECREVFLLGGGKGQRQSIIAFFCDHHVTKTKVYLATDCYVKIEHRGPEFCAPVTEECYLTYNGSFYDLRLLSSNHGHFWQDENDAAAYRLNVCDDLVGVQGCSYGSAVCKVPKQLAKETTASFFGNWEFTASATTQRLEIIPEGNYLQLTYFGGNNCPNRTLNGGHYVTKIRFECGNHVGAPVLVEENLDQCLLSFVWKSRVACPAKREAVDLVDGVIRDPVTETRINVSQLIHPTGPNHFDVEERRGGDKYFYFVRLGGPILFVEGEKDSKWKECSNSHVCQAKSDRSFYRNIGTNGTMQFYMEDGQLEADFVGGRCGRVPQKKVNTVIKFLCDPNGSYPEFVYESASCDYVFLWKTPHVCLRVDQILPTAPSTDSPTTLHVPSSPSTADATTASEAVTTTPAPAPATTTITTTTTTAAKSKFDSTTIPFSTTTEAVTSVPDKDNGNDDGAAESRRKPPVNHMVGAIIGIIAIAIVMFIVFYVASPRFRNKVLSLGQKLRPRRGSGFPYFDGNPDGDFDPITDNAFSYCQLDDAQEMNINRGRRTSAYGADLTTRATFVVDDDKEQSLNSTNTGSDLTNNRDDEFLML